MKYYSFLLLLVMLAAGLFAGCVPEGGAEIPRNSEAISEQPTVTQEEASYDFTGDAIAEGKLVYHICHAQLIHNLADIPETGALECSPDVAVGFGTGESEKVYPYPDFVTETGDFMDGAYLLLVDMTVDNIGARQYTTKDLNEFGDPRGKYDDPYVFEVWTFLVDPMRPYSTGYWSRNLDYYSRRNEREEHRLAFRIEPGESIDFTVGFFVSDKNAGGWYDIPALCLSPESGNPDGVLIPLNLKAGA